MVFIVVYDANVLYPSTLRDLLIRIAQSGLVQAKWTARSWMNCSARCHATGRISTRPVLLAHEA